MKDRIPVHVLMIDDDPAVRGKLAGWLGEHGFEIASMADTKSGIEHARNHRVDLALIDLNLPEIAGSELLAEMHRIQPTAALVALSAFPTPIQIEQARNAGAAEVLEKPVRQEALLTAVERQLDRIGIHARNEDEFNRRLGRSIRRLRRGAGLQQRDVAAAVGITAAQLSQIESGKTATSTWTLARISAALHQPLGAIFEEK